MRQRSFSAQSAQGRREVWHQLYEPALILCSVSTGLDRGMDKTVCASAQYHLSQHRVEEFATQATLWRALLKVRPNAVSSGKCDSGRDSSGPSAMPTALSDTNSADADVRFARGTNSAM